VTDHEGHEGDEGHDVSARVAEVRARIDAAARRAGRDPGEVTLVAATKTVPLGRIAEVVAAGIVELGENRAQELLAKAPALADRAVRWHFIGRVQRNKVRPLAPWVGVWHSIDRLDLAAAVARLEVRPSVLVQVNVDDDPAKGGCLPEDAPALVEALRRQGLEPAGLMTVPRLGPDPRPSFARLRALAGMLGVHELSMGMSDDFETAIGEGATIVRIGRALFGPRS
jgi:PLP dependent protein